MNELVIRAIRLNNAKVEEWVIAYSNKEGLLHEKLYRQIIIVYKSNKIKFQ